MSTHRFRAIRWPSVIFPHVFSASKLKLENQTYFFSGELGMGLPPTPRRPLESQHFQVIIIGGGLSGVSIARECARSGKSTLLLEQHDFASGATCRSSRIVEDGLSNLEQGEISQARELLRGKQELLRQSPYLVRPIHSLLALGAKSQHSAFRFRMRLWHYRKMAQSQLAEETLHTQQKKLEGLLDPRQKWSLYSSEDALCEFPERLVAEWLVEAIEAGAVARNHAQVLAVNVHHGRAQGVLVRDMLSGKEEQVQATWIINATGAWFRRLCQRSRISPGGIPFTNMRHTHIVLPRFPGAPDAMVTTTAVDGEPISILPWNEQILVGATEVPDRTILPKLRLRRKKSNICCNLFCMYFPRRESNFPMSVMLLPAFLRNRS